MDSQPCWAYTALFAIMLPRQGSERIGYER